MDKIKVFEFPRLFDIPNLSPFCCKLETWLRIARIPYEVVGRIPDTSLIARHLVKTRGVDPDARLDAAQRATALLVQRTLEEHYSFVLADTHLVRDEGGKHTRARFNAVPALLRGFVANRVRENVKKLLWAQGISRYAEAEIFEAAIEDWRAVLAVMSEGPFFFGDEPTSIDATVFGALAATVLTPIESPIRDFLRSQRRVVDYAERMRARLFPDLATQASRQAA